jgi:hypothetical protein
MFQMPDLQRFSSLRHCGALRSIAIGVGISNVVVSLTSAFELHTTTGDQVPCDIGACRIIPGSSIGYCAVAETRQHRYP